MSDECNVSDELGGIALLVVDSLSAKTVKNWPDYFQPGAVWSNMLSPTDSPVDGLSLTSVARRRLQQRSVGFLIVYVHWSAISQGSSSAESKVHRLVRFADELRSKHPVHCAFLAVSDGGLRDATVKPPEGIHVRLMRAAFPADGKHSQVARRHRDGFEMLLARPLADLLREGRGGDAIAVSALLEAFDNYLVHGVTSPISSHSNPPEMAPGDDGLNLQDQHYRVYLAFAALATAKEADLGPLHSLFSWEFWNPLLGSRRELWADFPEVLGLQEGRAQFPDRIKLIAAQPELCRTIAKQLLERAGPP